MSPRQLLFYSQWPLGYHNPEAERKALGFARAGHEVVYVAGLGIRNPGPSSLRKLVDRGWRKLRHSFVSPPPRGSAPLRTAALAVAPPRQVAAVRELNSRWLERQLRGALDWEEAVAWVRWPTPELVDALRRLRPAAIVYECVDAYEHTPGIVGVWREVFRRAEEALVDAASVVVVPSSALAERFRTLGAEVRLVRHGVDPERFPWREPRRSDGTATIGFVGTLDYRVDVAVLRRVAEARPRWRLRLIGPVQRGFDPAALADLPNVTVEPPVVPDRLGSTVATFDAGIMPYVPSPVYTYMCPVKNLELLAAGKPAVARPNPELERYRRHLYLAETPDGFLGQLDRALSEDSVERARERRAVAEANSWATRLAELRRIVEDPR